MADAWPAYLTGADWIEPLRAWPWPCEDWQLVLRRRSLYPVDRKALVEALRLQNAPYLARNPRLAESLRLLELETTFTVTTGQQVGWLTGPLYTIYKAVSAIQAANYIEGVLGPPCRVLPVFWMASEDHDAEEVRWMALRWGERLRYEGIFQGPVGRHRITAAFPSEVAHLPLQRHYEIGQRWEEAFRACLYELFQGTHLVVLSPDDPRLKSLTTDLWIQEIESQVTLHAHAQAIRYLQAHDRKPLLHARPLNLFWLSDTERRYIASEEKVLALAAAHKNPERLSPNVLLRPAFQERLLPNLAYVAGPTELRYWLELRWLFERLDVFYPVLWPRFSARVISDPPVRLSEEALERLFTSGSGWRRYLLERWEGPQLETFVQRLDSLRPAWDLLPDLPQAQKTLRQFWHKSLIHLRKAFYRQLRQKHSTALEALARWRDAVEPEGRLQERELNIHAVTSRPHELQEWIRALLSQRHLPGRMHFFRVGAPEFLQEANPSPPSLSAPS